MIDNYNSDSDYSSSDTTISDLNDYFTNLDDNNIPDLDYLKSLFENNITFYSGDHEENSLNHAIRCGVTDLNCFKLMMEYGIKVNNSKIFDDNDDIIGIFDQQNTFIVLIDNSSEPSEELIDLFLSYCDLSSIFPLGSEAEPEDLFHLFNENIPQYIEMIGLNANQFQNNDNDDDNQDNQDNQKLLLENAFNNRRTDVIKFYKAKEIVNNAIQISNAMSIDERRPSSIISLRDSIPELIVKILSKTASNTKFTKDIKLSEEESIRAANFGLKYNEDTNSTYIKPTDYQRLKNTIFKEL